MERDKNNPFNFNSFCFQVRGFFKCRVFTRSQLLLLMLSLTTPNLLLGCNSQHPKGLSATPSSHRTPRTISTALKSAIEELRVIKIKIEERGGINPKEYGENIEDLVEISNKSYGDAEVLNLMKSAVEGHKLAVQFWRCDRVTGYDEMHACQDKILKAVFAKYPDIEAQVKAVAGGEKQPFISAGLDKDAVLQAIWAKTGADTDAAVQAVTAPPPEKKRQS